MKFVFAHPGVGQLAQHAARALEVFGTVTLPSKMLSKTIVGLPDTV
jgi:hypothetical protein